MTDLMDAKVSSIFICTLSVVDNLPGLPVDFVF